MLLAQPRAMSSGLCGNCGMGSGIHQDAYDPRSSGKTNATQCCRGTGHKAFYSLFPVPCFLLLAEAIKKPEGEAQALLLSRAEASRVELWGDTDSQVRRNVVIRQNGGIGRKDISVRP